MRAASSDSNISRFESRLRNGLGRFASAAGAAAIVAGLVVPGVAVTPGLASSSQSASGNKIAQTVPVGGGIVKPPVVPGKQVQHVTSFRSAVGSKQLTFTMHGDGVLTKSVQLSLTNTTNKPLRVVIPANEIFNPSSAASQTMMSARDRLVLIPPNTTVSTDLPTLCVSPRSVPPPPPAGVEYSVGNYPDAAEWKSFAAINAAADQLSRQGKFDNIHLSDVRGTIAQFAVWTKLGRKSANPNDKVDANTFADQYLKTLSGEFKKDPDKAKKKFGGAFDFAADGSVIIKDEKKKKEIDSASTAIFAAIDLTLNLSDDPKLKVPGLPGASNWDTCIQVGERAFEKGDYVEADELLSAALEEAEKFGEGDIRLATTLLDLAKVNTDQGKYSDAQPQLERALRIQNKVSPDSPDVAVTENALGVLNLHMARRDSGGKGISTETKPTFDDAEKYFLKARELRTKVLGASSAEVGETLNDLAYLYILEDRGTEARPLLDQALAIRLKALGPDSPEVAEVNKNIGALYEKQGKYPLAEKFYKNALVIDVKALGKEHPYVATILDGLSNLARLQDKTDEAGSFNSAAKEIRKVSLGQNEELLASLPDDYQALTRIKNFAQETDKIEANTQVFKGLIVEKPKSNKPIKDKWALVIGVSKFKDPSMNLRYSDKDALAFYNYLIKDAHFRPDHVRLLLNEKATRENIMSQIGDKWLVRVTGPDDLVVIYFSGHGSPSTLDQKGVNYLVAYNTDKNSLFSTGINLKEFAGLVHDRVNSERVVMVMDACHSGAASATKGLTRIHNMDAESVAQGTGQLVICSSEPSQVSWESERYPNGVFTHYLIEGLKLKGPNTPLGDAYEYMKNKVREEVAFDRKEQQVPIIRSHWEGKDLVMGAPPSEIRPSLPADPSEISADSPQGDIESGKKSLGVPKKTPGAPSAPAKSAPHASVKKGT
jgi:tetratricopeptide (TPR) repeat protein